MDELKVDLLKLCEKLLRIARLFNEFADEFVILNNQVEDALLEATEKHSQKIKQLAEIEEANQEESNE